MDFPLFYEATSNLTTVLARDLKPLFEQHFSEAVAETARNVESNLHLYMKAIGTAVYQFGNIDASGSLTLMQVKKLTGLSR